MCSQYGIAISACEIFFEKIQHDPNPEGLGLDALDHDVIPCRQRGAVGSKEFTVISLVRLVSSHSPGPDTTSLLWIDARHRWRHGLPLTDIKDGVNACAIGHGHKRADDGRYGAHLLAMHRLIGNRLHVYQEHLRFHQLQSLNAVRGMPL